MRCIRFRASSEFTEVSILPANQMRPNSKISRQETLVHLLLQYLAIVRPSPTGLSSVPPNVHAPYNLWASRPVQHLFVSLIN